MVPLTRRGQGWEEGGGRTGPPLRSQCPISGYSYDPLVRRQAGPTMRVATNIANSGTLASADANLPPHVADMVDETEEVTGAETEG